MQAGLIYTERSFPARRRRVRPHNVSPQAVDHTGPFGYLNRILKSPTQPESQLWPRDSVCLSGERPGAREKGGLEGCGTGTWGLRFAWARAGGVLITHLYLPLTTALYRGLI